MNKNQQHWEFASHYLPGGVCSSARINNGLHSPFYIARAEGSKVYDLEGNEYVDLCTSFGSALIGHGHPKVNAAILESLKMGFMCAYENECHAQLAQRITETIPCIDLLRYALSGTETTYYAIKLAREYTGRTLAVKFEGHFHGFNDYLAYNYWPSREKVWPQITPAVEGLPAYLQQGFIVLPFNDFERVEETLTRRGEEIAAVIVEPVNFNSGAILPQPGFLELLRRLTAEYGILLIFDEILSGFRTEPGCMQATYQITPDLCTLGKAIGAGTPLSVFGGKQEVMQHISPLGKAQHSGTYNGHLSSMLAGLAFFDVILAEGFYEEFLPRCQRLYEGINEIMNRLGFVGRVQSKGARFAFLFGPPAERAVLRNYQDLLDNQWALLNRFYRACLNHGIYIHTMQHHGISSAHTDEDVAHLLEGIEAALREVMAEGIDLHEQAPAAPF
ncbi:MAG: aspartate aminotransferase family protein [Anaerolineae bacterium]